MTAAYLFDLHDLLHALLAAAANDTLLNTGIVPHTF
jgi:hypothetical protein